MARSLEKNVRNATGATKGPCAMFLVRRGQGEYRVAGEHARLFHGMFLTQSAVNKVIAQGALYPTTNRMSDTLAMH